MNISLRKASALSRALLALNFPVQKTAAVQNENDYLLALSERDMQISNRTLAIHLAFTLRRLIRAANVPEIDVLMTDRAEYDMLIERTQCLNYAARPPLRKCGTVELERDPSQINQYYRERRDVDDKINDLNSTTHIQLPTHVVEALQRFELI